MSHFDTDPHHDEEEEYSETIEMHECLADDADVDDGSDGPAPVEWEGGFSKTLFRKTFEDGVFTIEMHIQAERPLVVTREMRDEDIADSLANIADFCLAAAIGEDVIPDRLVRLNALYVIDQRDFFRDTFTALSGQAQAGIAQLEPGPANQRLIGQTLRSIARLKTIADRLDARLAAAVPALDLAMMDPPGGFDEIAH